MSPDHNPTNNRKPDKNMTTLTKRIIVLLFVATLVAVSSIACNTAHGFGKDVSNAGDGIQNGTR